MKSEIVPAGSRSDVQAAARLIKHAQSILDDTQNYIACAYLAMALDQIAETGERLR